MMPGSRTGFPAAAGNRVLAMAVLIFAWMPPTWAQIKSPARDTRAAHAEGARDQAAGGA